MKFYTDVLGLPGTYGGIIFDLEILYRLYRYGYRHHARFPAQDRSKRQIPPFILYASFPVTLLAIANFVGTPFDVTGKTVMATILFMLYGLFFSMMNCSYGAMVPAITKTPTNAHRWQHGVRVALHWAYCCVRWDSCRL